MDMLFLTAMASRCILQRSSIDEVAREVIQGKWGNGAERKKLLTAAGYDYNEVQKKVNQMI